MAPQYRRLDDVREAHHGPDGKLVAIRLNQFQFAQPAKIDQDPGDIDAGAQTGNQRLPAGKDLRSSLSHHGERLFERRWPRITKTIGKYWHVEGATPVLN